LEIKPGLILLHVCFFLFSTCFGQPCAMMLWCTVNQSSRWKRIVRQVGYLQRLYRDARSTEHNIACIVDQAMWSSFNWSLVTTIRPLTLCFTPPSVTYLMCNTTARTCHCSKQKDWLYDLKNARHFNTLRTGDADFRF